MDPAIDTAITRAMNDLKVPGCAVALIERGQVSEARGYGVADVSTGAPVTLDTRFSLQSVSKSIAAWATMKLVEQGRLDLDAPICRYLTRWPIPPSEFDLDLVTARRLLTHHAGVTVAGFRGVELHLGSYTLLDAMQGRLPPPTPEQQRHYDYWKLPRDDDLVTVSHPPGEGWRYSNPGFGILELAIEDITGESYADFVTREIFRPLNMHRAGFGRVPGELYARPHGRDGEPANDYRWLSGAAAGVYATIEDLATFACASMASPAGVPGRSVVSASALEAMYTSHGAADRSSGQAYEAGLGHVLLQTEAGLNVHHSGGSIGWRSIFSIFPLQGSGICMLMNGEAANDLWVPIVRRWRDGQPSPRAPLAASS